MSGDNSDQSVSESVIQSYCKLRGVCPTFSDVRNSVVDCMMSLHCLNKIYPIVPTYHCLSLFAVIIMHRKVS